MRGKLFDSYGARNAARRYIPSMRPALYARETAPASPLRSRLGDPSFNEARALCAGNSPFQSWRLSPIVPLQ